MKQRRIEMRNELKVKFDKMFLTLETGINRMREKIEAQSVTIESLQTEIESRKGFSLRA